jgi:class 3 adenylate cyclase/tetratricopeptide (TPR) repeat protein
MTELPSGTLTFLFTDVERSTGLWEKHPEAMRSALMRHDEILRSTVERHQGLVVKSTGDGVYAVFASAHPALDTCIDAQRALARERWPESTGPLRVRMGVHTGEAESRDGDYYGSTLNRASRLMAVGHGGQVLVSETVERLVSGALPADATLIDLGVHRLRDLADAMRVFQVAHPDIPRDFAPLRSLESVPGNLLEVAAEWPLAGRAEELRIVLAAIDRGRGIVIAGEAGVGKSRLAAEALARVGTTSSTAMCVANRAAASIPLGAFAPLVRDMELAPYQLADHFAATRRAVVERFDGGVLAVDDAHLLDEASAALLDQLARTSGIRLVVTVRTKEPAPDAVDALWKDRLLPRLELERLTPDDTGELLEFVLGGAVSDLTVRRFYDTSAGNALFLRELVVESRESGEIASRDGIWTWSGRIRGAPRLTALVARHMERLEPPQRQLLELIALSEPLPYAIAERIAGVSALATAEERRLIVVNDRHEVSLSHPLYGEVLRSELPLARLRAHVDNLSDTFSSTPTTTLSQRLRLTVLLLDAGVAAPVELLVAGALHSIARGNAALGERLGRAALEGRPDCFEAGYALAQALTARNAYGEAEAVLANLCGHEPDERAIAELAQARALIIYFGFPDQVERARIVLAAAESRVAEPGPRHLLMSAQAEVAFNELDFERALTLAEIVRHEPAASERARALATHVACLATIMTGAPDAAVTIVDSLPPGARLSTEEALDPSSGETDLERARASGWYLLDRWLALSYAGRLDEAEAICAAAIAEERPTDFAASPYAFVGRLEMMRGRARRATASLRQAVALLRVEDSRGYLGWALGWLAAARSLEADHEDAATMWAESDLTADRSRQLFEVDRLLAGAWVQAGRGELSEARAVATTVGLAAAEAGTVSFAVLSLYDAARLGNPDPGPLAEVAARCEGALADAIGLHAAAIAAEDGDMLAQAAERLFGIGLLLPAAEAYTQAAGAYWRQRQRAPALVCAAHARALVTECGDAHTPILAAAETTAAGLGPDATR